MLTVVMEFGHEVVVFIFLRYIFSFISYFTLMKKFLFLKIIYIHTELFD